MKRAWLIAALSVISALAVADEYQAFLQALAQRESSNNPAKKNDSGHLGLYQMSEAALIDAGYYKPDGTANNDWRGQWTGKDGIYSAEDYLNSVAAQNNAIQAYHQKLWSYIEAEGLDQLVGQTVDGVQVTPAALLAGAHLIGAQGLANCLSTATGCADGNGTKAMSYMALFGGYDVASVTGVSWSGGGGGGSGGSTNSDLGGTGGGSGPKEYSGYPLSGYTAPSASEAFSRGAGVEMARIRQFVLETLSVILLLWLAWISLAQYSNWRNGVASMMQMQSSIVRAAVFVSLMLIIFFAV